jgi:transposase
MADKIAGIDVHKKVLMVVVIDARTPESKAERRRFATMPSELRRLSTWLQERGVEEAVMESTAQYWRSVWLELEPHMCLHLAQAFSNRAPRGRKHDFKDAERLVRRLMKLQLTRDRERIQSQIECLLEEMRVKLSIVVSDLLGSSGLRILHALANGETDAKSLALLGDDPGCARCAVPHPVQNSESAPLRIEVHRRTAGRSLNRKIASHARANARAAAGAAAVT